jgi:hypothetical protein
MILLSLLIVACLVSTPIPVTETPTEEATQLPTEPPRPEASATEPPVTEAPATEPARQLSGSGADPQRVEFEAEDEAQLVGYYYPSKYANAPVMILMHWAGGDLCDWRDIALWLQNRLDENPAPIERCANPGSASWWDSSWFAPMAADASIAVFTFDFRGHGESEIGGAGSILIKDAKAAFTTAAGLEGVDPSRLAALGASIGADAAADGCLLYNQEVGKGCVGVFPLSPDSYLGMRYMEVVEDLSPIPVWCHAGELDRGPARSCEAAYGEGYNFINYPGTEAHGMQLFSPELNPPLPVLVQVFIESVFMEWVEVQ